MDLRHNRQPAASDGIAILRTQILHLGIYYHKRTGIVCRYIMQAGVLISRLGKPDRITNLFTHLFSPAVIFRFFGSRREHPDQFGNLRKFSLTKTARGTGRRARRTPDVTIGGCGSNGTRSCYRYAGISRDTSNVPVLLDAIQHQMCIGAAERDIGNVGQPFSQCLRIANDLFRVTAEFKRSASPNPAALPAICISGRY